ncbi:hypothetical protein M0813_05279 [Anaeramoeba flamelloides]|uniref:Transmembrane protein n=1 Tax=Anaeramoeba flamelloides TaxID=1746091 RepID=A0ABQ8XLC6_9EUKA|nr:hypothetical protein M0813_05279 [Anaeramoeba flamelloides]
MKRDVIFVIFLVFFLSLIVCGGASQSSRSKEKKKTKKTSSTVIQNLEYRPSSCSSKNVDFLIMLTKVQKWFNKSSKKLTRLESFFSLVNYTLTLFVFPAYLFIRAIWKCCKRTHSPEQSLRNIEKLLVAQQKLQSDIILLLHQSQRKKNQLSDHQKLKFISLLIKLLLKQKHLNETKEEKKFKKKKNLLPKLNQK